MYMYRSRIDLAYKTLMGEEPTGCNVKQVLSFCTIYMYIVTSTKLNSFKQQPLYEKNVLSSSHTVQV